MSRQGIPGFVAEGRKLYWKKRGRGFYSGKAHLYFTNIVAAVVAIYSLMNLENVTPLELLTIPLTLLYGNVVEYFGHRGPMHRKIKFLEPLFQRHTIEHHRFFIDRAMNFESFKDLRVVLFPPVLIFFFIGLFVIPVGMILHSVTTSNIGYLFMVSAIFYYISYEWLHLYYHSRTSKVFDRFLVFRKLKEAHRIHHAPRYMNRFNFNLTYPFIDWIMGTRIQK